MEWYRILIILAGAVGLLAGIANWYFNGTDMPNGLVTLLSLIISATLGPDAFAKAKGAMQKPPTVTDVVTDTEPVAPAPIAVIEELTVKEVEADAGA